MLQSARAVQGEGEEAKRLIAHRLRRYQKDKHSLISDVEEWLGGQEQYGHAAQSAFVKPRLRK
jgi:hypothetical protein